MSEINQTIGNENLNAGKNNKIFQVNQKYFIVF